MPQLDVRELGEALNSASKMMETMISNIQRFMPKVRQMREWSFMLGFFNMDIKIGLVIKLVKATSWFIGSTVVELVIINYIFNFI